MGILRRLIDIWRGPTPELPGATRRALPAPNVKATLAEGIPISWDGRPLWQDWDPRRAVRDGLKRSVWVYACAWRTSTSIASVPLRVYAKGTDDVLDDHPLQILIDNPNEYWSEQDFKELLVLQLLMAGNAYISPNVVELPGVGKVTAELWLLPPHQMRPVPTRNGYLSHYVRMIDGRETIVPSEEVLQLMLTDPSNPWLGMSPMQAAARTIDTEVEAVTWNKVALQNRAVSDGMVSFKHPLTPQQWKDARKQVREQHMGSRNARVPWVLGNDANWVKMSESAVEMDFIESRKMNRIEICATFGVPPIMVGIEDHTTYNNYSTAREVFWQDTLVPFMANITDALNRGLVGMDGDVEIRFDTSDNAVLNRLTEEMARVASAFHAMGVPFNMINDRLKLGFPEVPGGDIGYVSGNLTPVDALSTDAFSVNVEEPVVEMEEAETIEQLEASVDRLALMLKQESRQLTA